MPCAAIIRGDRVAGRLCYSTYTYRVYVRRFGHRKWEMQKGVHKTYARAYARLCKVFASGDYKRGMVTACPDSPYYDPECVCELNLKGGYEKAVA